MVDMYVNKIQNRMDRAVTANLLSDESTVNLNRLAHINTADKELKLRVVNTEKAKLNGLRAESSGRAVAKCDAAIAAKNYTVMNLTQIYLEATTGRKMTETDLADHMSELAAEIAAHNEPIPA